MEDKQIVDLYWQRSQDAVYQTDLKYGRMLYNVSFPMTNNRQDSEECVNDTYLRAWNSMPTDRPDMLGAYLTKIVRALSIDRYRREYAKKRGGPGVVTEELSDVIPSDFSMDDHIDNEMLKNVINGFLRSLDERSRAVFVKRYYFCLDTETICRQTGMKVSAVKMSLLRMRRKLASELEKEGLL